MDAPITIELPYPPSGNRQARHTKTGGHYLNPAVAQYRGKVAFSLAGMGWGGFGTKKPLQGPLMLSVVCAPDSNRATDADNRLKCLLDALVHGGLLEDDSNRVLRRVEWEWTEPIKNGAVLVTVRPFVSQC